MEIDYIKKIVKIRLSRLIHLRSIGAPMWVIKSEQVALYMDSKGRKHYGTGKKSSKLQANLYKKHVLPLMGVE